MGEASSFLVDERDRRFTSPLNGVHPWQAVAGKDADVVRQNAHTSLPDPANQVMFSMWLQKQAGEHKIAVFSAMEYLHAVKIPLRSEKVDHALQDPIFQPLTLPERRPYGETTVEFKIWVMLPTTSQQREEGLGSVAWNLLFRAQMKGDQSDQDMDPEIMVMDKFAAKAFDPQSDDSNIAIQVFVFNRDGTIGAYCWGDSEELKMLGVPESAPGEAEVVVLGFPKFVFEFDRRRKGSNEGLLSDGTRFEFMFYDGLNRLKLKSSRIVMPVDAVVVTGVQGGVLQELLRKIRTELSHRPRVQSPDQILSLPQLAAGHEWWYKKTLLEGEERKPETARLMLMDRGNMHWSSVAALQWGCPKRSSELVPAIQGQAELSPVQVQVEVAATVRSSGVLIEDLTEEQDQDQAAEVVQEVEEKDLLRFATYEGEYIKICRASGSGLPSWLKVPHLVIDGKQVWITVPAKPGRVCEAFLQPGEKSVSVHAGEELAWRIAQACKVVYNTTPVHLISQREILTTLCVDLANRCEELFAAMPAKPKAPPPCMLVSDQPPPVPKDLKKVVGGEAIKSLPLEPLKERIVDLTEDDEFDKEPAQAKPSSSSSSAGSQQAWLEGFSSMGE